MSLESLAAGDGTSSSHVPPLESIQPPYLPPDLSEFFKAMRHIVQLIEDNHFEVAETAEHLIRTTEATMNIYKASVGKHVMQTDYAINLGIGFALHTVSGGDVRSITFTDQEVKEFSDTHVVRVEQDGELISVRVYDRVEG